MGFARCVDMKKLLLLILFIGTFLGVIAQNTLSYTANDKNFRKGLELLDREKYTSASHFFERYLEESPDHLLAVEASYYIAFCSMNLENRQAEKYIGKFISDYPTHPKTVTARYDAGMFYFKKAKYKEAIANLEKVDTQQLSKEQRAETIFSLGYAYFIEQEYQKALPKFEAGEQLVSPYTYASAYYAGYIYFKNKAFEKAIGSFEKAGENKTYASVVPFMITNIYYHQHNYKDVITYGGQIIKDKRKVSNKNAIILLVGTAYFAQDDYKNALKYLKPYVKGKRASDATKYRAGYAGFKEEKIDFAQTQFKRLASDKDSLGQASAYYLGHCYLKTNKGFAKNSFKVASGVAFDKEIQANSVYNLAKLQYEDKEFTEAIKNLKRLNTEFSTHQFKTPKDEILTEAYLNANNLDDAIAYIDNIRYPNKRVKEIYKEVTYLKGVSLFNREDHKGAIKYFTKSLATSGAKKFTVSSYYWRAEALSILFQWDKAKKDYAGVFRSTTAKDDYYRKARYGIGYAYFNSEKEKNVKYDKALGHFKKYIETVTEPKKDKYLDDAYLRLADCHYKKKAYQTAIKEYKEAIKRDSKSSDYAYYQIAHIYSVLEDYSQSAKNYDVLLSKYKNSVYVEDAMYNKAKNLYSTGKYGPSIAHYDAYLAKYSATERVPVVYLERAVAYLNSQNYNKALEDFDEVLYSYCTDTVYSAQALKGTQESLSLLKRSVEYDKRLEQYFKCGGKGKERLTYEASRNNYRNKEYELSIRGFERFLREYPSSVFVYDVNYYLGMAYFSYGDKKKTKQYLYKVKSAKQKFHFEEALIVLSEIYLDEKQWAKANEINAELLNITKSEQKRQLILLELLVGTYELKAYDKSLGYANQILGSESRLVYAVNKASLYKGLIYYNKKELKKSTDEFVLLSNNSKDVYGAQAHYMVAKIKYDEGEYLEALETVKALLETRKDYLVWYGEAYVLASQCYIALGEEFQGKAYLKDVIANFPVKSVVAHAKKVLYEVENKVVAQPVPDSTVIEQKVEESIEKVEENKIEK